MIIKVAMREGDRWIECYPDDLKVLVKKPAAIKYGKWIYDFKLKELGYPPIRAANY